MASVAEAPAVYSDEEQPVRAKKEGFAYGVHVRSAMVGAALLLTAQQVAEFAPTALSYYIALQEYAIGISATVKIPGTDYSVTMGKAIGNKRAVKRVLPEFVQELTNRDINVRNDVRKTKSGKAREITLYSNAGRQPSMPDFAFDITTKKGSDLISDPTVVFHIGGPTSPKRMTEEDNKRAQGH